MLPRVRKLRHQIIHQDAHGGNVLVDPDNPTNITGIIDFGDMLYGSLVAEIAVATDSAEVKIDLLPDVICETAAGFDSVLPLEAEEIDDGIETARRQPVQSLTAVTIALDGPCA